MTSPAPHTQRQRRASREDVRRRVLDSARREFAAHGFDGVSLDQIAAAAGFSKGAVYSNFATKSDLFMALMDESVTTRLEAARELQSDGADADVARRLGDHLIAEFAEDSDWQVLLIEFWLRAMRDPSAREPFVEYRRRMRETIAGEFERVFPAGDSELTSMEVATTILALSNGLAIERLLDPEAGDEALLGVALGRVLGSGADPDRARTNG